MCSYFVLIATMFANFVHLSSSSLSNLELHTNSACGMLTKWLFIVPAVHVEPLHPAVHTQVLGAVHVPPFGQDVAPEHRAECR